MSSERSRWLAVQALVAVGAMVGLLCFREAGRRSLFSESIDGRVVGVDVRTEKHPGHDDRYYLTIDDQSRVRTLEVDGALAMRVAEGMRLESEPWADGVVVDGQRVRTQFSEDTVLLGLALWCGLLVAPTIDRLRAMTTGRPKARED